MLHFASVILIISKQSLRHLLLICTSVIMLSFLFLWPTTKTYPLHNYIIAIDPGHGGTDTGSSHAGYTEKELTLLLSDALAKQLKKDGAIPVLTRTTDTDLWDQVSVEEEIEFTKEEYEQNKQLERYTHPLDRYIALGTRTPPRYRLGLRARLLIARQNTADVLISLHTNHYRSEAAQGAVTLYQANSVKSKLLAQAIQKYLGPLLPGRSEPGYIPDNFFILRNSDVTAVIVEIGFISNIHDRNYLLSEEGRQAIVLAISDGLQEYFTSLDKKDIY